MNDFLIIDSCVWIYFDINFNMTECFSEMSSLCWVEQFGSVKRLKIGQLCMKLPVFCINKQIYTDLRCNVLDLAVTT